MRSGNSSAQIPCPSQAMRSTRRARGCLAGGLAEAQRASDLGSVVLDGPARPVVVTDDVGGHVNLAGDVGDRRRRQLFGASWKAAFLFEELQQEAESDLGRSGLVPDQPQIVINERPRCDQVLWFPLLAHGSSPWSSPGNVEEPRTARGGTRDGSPAGHIILRQQRRLVDPVATLPLGTRSGALGLGAVQDRRRDRDRAEKGGGA